VTANKSFVMATIKVSTVTENESFVTATTTPFITTAKYMMEISMTMEKLGDGVQKFCDSKGQSFHSDGEQNFCDGDDYNSNDDIKAPSKGSVLRTSTGGLLGTEIYDSKRIYDDGE